MVLEKTWAVQQMALEKAMYIGEKLQFGLVKKAGQCKQL